MKVKKELKGISKRLTKLENLLTKIDKKTSKPITVIVPSTKNRINNFYCGPEKNTFGEVSTINFLTRKIGTIQNGVKTLKTDYISSKYKTDFNNLNLSLKVEGDYIRLVIKESSKSAVRLKCWPVSKVRTSMQLKNPTMKLNDTLIKEMVDNGTLIVKFIVSEIKDHGTYWKIDRK